MFSSVWNNLKPEGKYFIVVYWVLSHFQSPGTVKLGFAPLLLTGFCLRSVRWEKWFFLSAIFSLLNITKFSLVWPWWSKILPRPTPIWRIFIEFQCWPEAVFFGFWNAEPATVVPILLSAAFLEMDVLVEDCLNYCHSFMNQILDTKQSFSCLSDSLIERYVDIS